MQSDALRLKLVFVFAIVVCCRAQGSPDPEGSGQRWPRGVAIVLEVVEPAVQRGQVKLLAVDHRGAFAERHLAPPAKGVDGDRSSVSAWSGLIPVDYIFHDGRILTQSQSPGMAYFEAESAGEFAEGFGPIQWAACPWPMVPTLMDRLGSAGAIRAGRGQDRYEYSASMDDQAGRQRMSLVFGSDGSLVEARVDRDNGGSSLRSTWEFLESRETQGALLPGRVRFAHELDTPSRRVRGSTEYRVLAASTDPDEVAKVLSREIVVRNHNRFDRETTNLYAPDGTFIHNEREFIERLDGMAARRDSRRPYVLAGLIGLIGVSAVLIWRKWGPR